MFPLKKNLPTIAILKKTENDWGWHFTVKISDDDSATEHIVTMTTMAFQKLTGGKAEPDDLILKSFEFLLKHEPKESILPMFELDIIASYYPDWERAMIKKFS